MRRVLVEPFIWRPGLGPDEEAVARLRQRTPRPSEPMGEAWFMGDERRRFTALSSTRFAQLDPVERSEILRAIASGIKHFGDDGEWIGWFRYLLPDLVTISHESWAASYWYEPLMTCFITVHWTGIEEQYQGERNDLLRTVGRCIMKPVIWSDAVTVNPRTAFRLGAYEGGRTCWDHVSGDFSASMYFCMKYLAPEELSAWIDSFMEIRADIWRGQLLFWLFRALPPLRRARFTADDLAPSWHDNEGLGRFGEEPHQRDELVSAANRDCFVHDLRARLTPDVLCHWLESIAEPELDYTLRVQHVIDTVFEQLH